MKRSLSTLLRALLLLTLAGTAPCVLAKSDGEEELENLIEQGVVLENELADYVRRVGGRIARAAGLQDGEIVFNVLDRANLNAFAMQGGYVFVERGLLVFLETEDQLAAVLGHEVGHLTARHPQQRKSAVTTSKIASTLVGFITRSRDLMSTTAAYSQAQILGYGREQELEADGLGARYLEAAGYDPIAMLDVIRVLKDDDIFSREVEGRASSYHGLFASHPRNDRRLFEVVEAGAASAAPPDEIDHEGDFLGYVDGLAWGDMAADGLVRGTRYYHGALGFVMDFPTGWRVTDSTSVITGTAPHGTRTLVTVELQSFEDDELTPEKFVTESLGLVTAGGREIEVDGMKGFMAMVPVESEDYELQFIAVVFKDSRAFVIKGDNRVAEFEGEFVEGFSRTVASFRHMRRSDVEAATTSRVRVVEATPEDSYEMLARRGDLGRNGPDRLRLLNGDYPRGQPRAGDRIKIVE